MNILNKIYKMLGPIISSKLDNLITFIFPYLLEMHHLRIFGNLSMLEFPGNLSMLEVLAVVLLSIYQTARSQRNYSSARLFGNCISWICFWFSMAVLMHWIFSVNALLNWQLGILKCAPDFNSLNGLFDC